MTPNTVHEAERRDFEARIEHMKQNPIDYELKLLRELEETVREKRPTKPMLIGLDRLRKLAEE